MLDRKNHPRPQFIRADWQSLDGQWQFKFDDDNQGLKAKWYQDFGESQEITVPFTYETELSGIHDESHHNVVWYHKTFDQANADEVTAIYFEGVDYHAQVWLNGQQVGEHMGGYERFDFDLTPYLVAGENQLVLRVSDSLACEQPRGKQRWQKDNFGCWYVQTTGIWKSVWLETRTSAASFEQVKITPELDADQVVFEPFIEADAFAAASGLIFEAEVRFDGQTIDFVKGVLNHQGKSFSVDTRLKTDPCWGTRPWTPENPHLYDVTFRLYDLEGGLLDEVISYFGMRKISIEKGQVLLNNQQLYQRLILDQGYWAESGITPPSVAAMELDIKRIQELGYNGLRKHQKTEDERFLYLCDSLGLLVWCEMPSTYTFNDLAVTKITAEWSAIVKQFYNHPSIITWVPFNESWGIKDIAHDVHQQKFTEAIYHLTKAYDKNRPVITNDGWVHTISDIITLHDYEEYGEVFSKRYADKEALMNNELQFNKDFYAFADGYSYKGQPILISEFGGIAFSTEKSDEWGYGHQVKNEAEFMARFDGIHQAVQDLPYVIGFCYTQLTDVEQEVNGLLDTKREPKVDMEAVRKINLRRLK